MDMETFLEAVNLTRQADADFRLIERPLIDEWKLCRHEGFETESGFGSALPERMDGLRGLGPVEEGHRTVAHRRIRRGQTGLEWRQSWRLDEHDRPIGYECALIASGVVWFSDLASEERLILRRRQNCLDVKPRLVTEQAIPGTSDWLLSMSHNGQSSRKPFCDRRFHDRLSTASAGEDTDLLRAQIGRIGPSDPSAPYALSQKTAGLAARLLARVYADAFLAPRP